MTIVVAILAGLAGVAVCWLWAQPRLTERRGLLVLGGPALLALCGLLLLLL